MNLIDFARDCRVRGPCAEFVACWLAEHGKSDLPSLQEIMRDWRRYGVEKGVEVWCERLGLIPCDNSWGDVALVTQRRGGLLLGVLDLDGLFVTRSFSRVLIERNPMIVKAWRV